MKYCGDAEWFWGGAKKSQKCHTHFLQYSTFASERPQVQTWGRQTCFLPRAPSNLVRPLSIRRLVPSRNSSTHLYVAKLRCRQTAESRTALATTLRLFSFSFWRLDKAKNIVYFRVFFNLSLLPCAPKSGAFMAKRHLRRLGGGSWPKLPPVDPPLIFSNKT